MSTAQIYKKTMPFIMARFVLGLIVVGAGILLALPIIGITMLFKSALFGFIGLFIWLALIGVVSFIVNHYFAYMIKAGHVAAVTYLAAGETIEGNILTFGKDMVKERFAESNVYFVIDKLIAKSVQAIQSIVGGISSMFKDIPGVSTIVNLLQMFIGIYLSYVDECCLGYTFLNTEESAFKLGADAVVIYAQNWKKLAGSAFKVMLIVIVSSLIVFGISLGICYMPIALFGLDGNIAVILAFLLTATVKSSFIDPYIMIGMVSDYMAVAVYDEPKVDIEDKLKKVSKHFRELIHKGYEESNEPAYE